jgi:hypothetical protein
MDLMALRHALEKEIAEHVCEAHSAAIGLPMSPEWVREQLADMRDALVDPHWREILVRNSACQITGNEEAELRECILLADDRRGHELYFDPVTRDYFLAFSGEPPATFAVRSDAVSCFMAR